MCTALEILEAHRVALPSAPSPSDFVDAGGSGVDNSMSQSSWSHSSLEHSDTVLRGASICGVELVWVAETARRRGVGAIMVDLARAHLVYGGHVLPKEAVAFSDPTRDGRQFAAAYSQGRKDFFTFSHQ
jgi:hypothetical protein